MNWWLGVLKTSNLLVIYLFNIILFLLILNWNKIAIQLGEIYCDLNGIFVPHALGEKVNKAIDPYNDTVGK